MKRNSHWLIFILFICSVGVANDQLVQFDKYQYSPIKYGLNDLIFEIRINGIEKDLREKFALDKLDDPRFKIYWMAPGRIDIEVLGLPPGFQNLKQELKKLVYERIEYVVPQDISSRLRGYQFNVKKLKSNNTQLIGKDETNTKPINRIEIIMSNSGEIVSMKTVSPSGSQTAKFKVATKEWSHSKNVVEKVELVGISGIQKTTSSTDIVYIAKDGFGFPTELKTKTTIEAMTNTKNNPKNEVESILSFGSYEVNSGKAQKHIMSLNEKN